MFAFLPGLPYLCLGLERIAMNVDIEQPGHVAQKSGMDIWFSLGLLFVYVWATSGSLIWIWSQSAATEQVIMGAGAVIALVACIKFLGLPRRALPFSALILIVVFAALSRASFHILQQLSASFALFGFYGFAPAFLRMSPTLWRQGMVLAFLAALALPFALVPGTGAGFYLRLLTADISAMFLDWFGHSSMGANDVLIFENGIAQVDMPCSGLKSLFTGTAFFLAASLILKRPVTWRWLLVYGLFVLCLLSANILRVTTLIFLSEVQQWRDLADQLHVIIGVALFVGNCVLAVVFLRWLPKGETLTGQFPPSKLYGTIIASAAVGVFVLLFSTQPSVWNKSIDAPDFIQLDEAGLTPAEIRFFSARGQSHARKWRFTHDALSGSILVVKSRAANGLHAPEICLMGNGLTIDSMQSRDWDDWQSQKGKGDFRALSLNEDRYSAVYWMQSDGLITDDFRKRLTQYALGRHNEWIMVTILFDQSLKLDKIDAKNPAVAELMQGLQSFYRRGKSL